jgi:hypothetical protein
LTVAAASSGAAPEPGATKAGEYDVTFFGERLGLGLREPDRSTDLPTVAVAPTDLPKPGDLLVAVNGSPLLGAGHTYQAALALIQHSGRPLVLTFRATSPSEADSTAADRPAAKRSGFRRLMALALAVVLTVVAVGFSAPALLSAASSRWCLSNRPQNQTAALPPVFANGFPSPVDAACRTLALVESRWEWSRWDLFEAAPWAADYRRRTLALVDSRWMLTRWDDWQHTQAGAELLRWGSVGHFMELTSEVSVGHFMELTSEVQRWSFEASGAARRLWRGRLSGTTPSEVTDSASKSSNSVTTETFEAAGATETAAAAGAVPGEETVEVVDDNPDPRQDEL